MRRNVNQSLVTYGRNGASVNCLIKRPVLLSQEKSHRRSLLCGGSWFLIVSYPCNGLPTDVGDQTVSAGISFFLR